MANQWDGQIVLDNGGKGFAYFSTDASGNMALVGQDGQAVVVYVLPSGDTTGVMDRLAIQAAHDSLPSNGGEIRAIRGVFYLDDEVVFTKPVTLIGAGGGIAGNAGTAVSLAPTTINCISADNNGFNVQSAGCAFRDFALINTYAGTPTAGAGILSTENNNVTIDAVTVLGFWNLLDLGGVYHNVVNCKLYDAVNYYLYHHSPSSIYDDHGDFSVIGCVLSGWKKNYSAVAQFRWESGGGIKLLGNKFNSGGQPGNASAGVAAHAIQLLAADGKTTGSVVISGNSISGWASNTSNIYIGQLGPTKDGRLSSVKITGNEIAVGAQGITIEGNATYDDRIRGVAVDNNVFSYISGSSVKVQYTRQAKIGVNQHVNSNTSGPVIDIPDLNSSCLGLSVDIQHIGEKTSQDIIRDNRSIGNTAISLQGGVKYDYTHGLGISTVSTWTQVFKLEVPNQAAGKFVLDIDGRSTDSTNTSANRKGVCIRQERAFDVNASGTVTVSTIGTDFAAGAGSGFVSVRYTVTPNWIAVEVQTTDATNCVLWGTARIQVNGKLQTFHIGT